MRQQTGFTLLELMIVVAVIAIIAAIAIPNLLRARLQSNEASAIENSRTIATAQLSYHSAHKTFADFAGLVDNADGEPFLDGTWQEGVVKSGYVFSIDSFSEADFVCYADPRTAGKTGNRYFRVDGSGTIRYGLGGRPDAAASPID